MSVENPTIQVTVGSKRPEPGPASDAGPRRSRAVSPGIHAADRHPRGARRADPRGRPARRRRAEPADPARGQRPEPLCQDRFPRARGGPALARGIPPGRLSAVLHPGRRGRPRPDHGGTDQRRPPPVPAQGRSRADAPDRDQVVTTAGAVGRVPDVHRPSRASDASRPIPGAQPCLGPAMASRRRHAVPPAPARVEPPAGPVHRPGPVRRRRAPSHRPGASPGARRSTSTRRRRSSWSSWRCPGSTRRRSTWPPPAMS